MSIFYIQAQEVAVKKGTLAGKVSDAKSGEDIIGATVSVENTTNGSSTDLDGKYFLKLNPGVYTIVVSYVSYKTKKLEGIEIKAGELNSINIALSEDSKELEEIVVTGEAKKESAAGLLLQQKNAVAVSSGVSADLIRKMPDRTTADVIKRVSGASIQDGKFAVIRGLSDRYNFAFLNGAPLPSSESDRKAFSLDIVPAQVLDNMTIQKTATPDMPGDFAGGFININTKDIPDENVRFAQVGLSYHSITTFKQFYTSPQSGSTDFLGFDNGKRALPGGILSTEQAQSLSPGSPTDNPTLVHQTALLNNQYVPNSIKSARPNVNMQLMLSQRAKLFKNDFGVILGLIYSNNLQYTPFSNNTNNLNASTTLETITRSPITNDLQGTYYDNQRYRTQVQTGGILNLAYKVGANNKFSFKNLLTVNSDDQYILRNGYSLAPSDDEVKDNNSVAYYYQSNRMYSSQFNGDHFLESSKIKIHYTLGYTNINREVPDYKRLFYQSRRQAGYSDYSTNQAVFLQDANNAAFTPNSSGKFYSNLSENSYSINYDFSIPFYFLGKNDLKVGGMHQFRQRDFKARNYLNSFNGDYLGDVYTNILPLSPDLLFSPNNFSANSVGIYTYETTQKSDKYTASSMLNAGFAMIESKLTSKLRIIYGVRLESFNQRLSSASLGKDVNVNTTVLDPLPSVNVIYGLTESSNLRASYSRTVSRPEFREFAPLAFYEMNYNAVIQGNADLKRARIDNFDLKYEIYPSPGSFFSVNPFVKYFKTPVEMTFEQGLGQSGIRSFSYKNALSAINYGVEIETRFNLARLDKIASTSIFKNFTVFGNYTWIRSSVDISNTQANFSSRPLQGQSPYVVNAGIQYTDEARAFDVTLSVNRIGRRIAFIANQTYDIIWENPRTIVDFSVSKTLYKKLQMKFIVGDLLAQSLVYYQDLDFNKTNKLSNNIFPFSESTYDETKDVVAFKYKYGSTFSFNLAYNF